MANILITGCNGQLGNEIRILSQHYSGYNFIFTDIEHFDICNKEEVKSFIDSCRPDWIINCAAYNYVDKAESEPAKAMRINGEAVEDIIGAIRFSSCKFIHFSTDYVFDGSANTPYAETAIPNPQTAYGISKYEGEKAALQYHSSMIIRTSWLYSSFGSNFVKKIIAKTNETSAIDVVYDQTGTPTYAADLAKAVMNIVSGVIRNKVAFTPGIFHYSNEGVCSWYDFAKAIVEESGIEVEINPVHTDKYCSKAHRPAYSVLDKQKIKDVYNIKIPYWRCSLEECIKLISQINNK